MKQNLAKMPKRDEMQQDRSPDDEAMPDSVPVPASLVPHLSETAILLDIDGTLLDLMPTPREVWVPPGLRETLNGLLKKTSGALAIALFYAIGTAIGGVAGPALFGVLIDTGSRESVFAGYLFGAVLMIAAAAVAWRYAVAAERKSLESVARPLAFVE